MKLTTAIKRLKKAGFAVASMNGTRQYAAAKAGSADHIELATDSEGEVYGVSIVIANGDKARFEKLAWAIDSY
jgi:acetolactate synthase regulatory subunit